MNNRSVLIPLCKVPFSPYTYTSYEEDSGIYTEIAKRKGLAETTLYPISTGEGAALPANFDKFVLSLDDDAWAVSGNIVRVKYTDTSDSSVVYCYFKITDEGLTWPSKAEVDSATFVNMTKHKSFTPLFPKLYTCWVFTYGVDDVKLTSEKWGSTNFYWFHYNWTYKGKPYSYRTKQLYPRDSILMAIVGDVLFVIDADTTDYLTEDNGTSVTYFNIVTPVKHGMIPGIFRAEPVAEKDSITEYGDWTDIESLYVDGQKWYPVRQRDGEHHDPSSSSPCVRTSTYTWVEDGIICEEE